MTARPDAEYRRYGTSTLAAAYGLWVEARAGLAKVNGRCSPIPRVDPDAETDALLDQEGEALWEVIRHPAKNIDDVRSRCEVLMHECRAVMEQGPPRDNHLTALAAALCRDLDALPRLMEGISED